MRGQSRRANTERDSSREASSVYTRVCQKMQANVFGCEKLLKLFKESNNNYI